MSPPGSAGTIVVAGALAQRPRRPGHAWVFLQYLLGFRRLGFDVLFLDRIPDGTPTASARVMVDWLRNVLAAHDLGDAWSLAMPSGAWLGIPKAIVRDRSRDALLLNVNGYLIDPELLAAARTRVYLDIDPGFVQMWQGLGLADLLAGHDHFLTVSQRIGASDCAIPTLDLPWVATLPPVVLEHWPLLPAQPNGAFTSIATWRGPFAPVVRAGQTFGLRVHEFRRYLDLPQRSGARFALALDIDAADEADRCSLEQSGWLLSDPVQVAGDDHSYRAFIARSKAELCIAKAMYVKTLSGWFSDRSACYLASGRPVVALDTGFGERLQAGVGLVAFDSLAGAEAAVRDVEADLPRHATAARRIAEASFDSDIVLTRILRKLNQPEIRSRQPS